MAGFETDGSGRVEEELVQIRREFTRSLTQRAASMQSALATLRHGADQDAIEQFFLTAHSLGGTAGAFGAHVLAEHSARLAEIGRRWRAGEAISPPQLEAAGEDLDRLVGAIVEFQRVEGQGS